MKTCKGILSWIEEERQRCPYNLNGQSLTFPIINPEEIGDTLRRITYFHKAMTIFDEIFEQLRKEKK